MPYYELGEWIYQVSKAKKDWENSKLCDIDADLVHDMLTKSNRNLSIKQNDPRFFDTHVKNVLNGLRKEIMALQD